MVQCTDCGEDKEDFQMGVISGSRGVCDPCLRIERHENAYHDRNPDPRCPSCRPMSVPAPFSIKSLEEGAKAVLKAIERGEKKNPFKGK